MANEIIKGKVAEEQVGRIDLFVRTLLNLSRSKLDGLFDRGCIALNKKPCENPAARVSKGDWVVITYDPHQGYSTKKKPWSDRTFTIIHEDDSLIVVGKTAGVLTNPTAKTEPNTLLERVTNYLCHRKKNSAAALIHRLDRGVSGVMVFGKTPKVAQKLREQFDTNKAKRVFVALVNGVMEQEQGTFESWLETHKNLNRFSTEERSGQHAVTDFMVRKRMEDATAVELELKTARRHQARVQFAEAGHPIVGDLRYADQGRRKRPILHERWSSKRLALHAVSITFIHPATEKEVTYNCDLPTPMKKFMRGM